MSVINISIPRAIASLVRPVFDEVIVGKVAIRTLEVPVNAVFPGLVFRLHRVAGRAHLRGIGKVLRKTGNQEKDKHCA